MRDLEPCFCCKHGSFLFDHNFHNHWWRSRACCRSVSSEFLRPSPIRLLLPTTYAKSAGTPGYTVHALLFVYFANWLGYLINQVQEGVRRDALPPVESQSDTFRLIVVRNRNANSMKTDGNRDLSRKSLVLSSHPVAFPFDYYYQANYYTESATGWQHKGSSLLLFLCWGIHHI